MDIIREGEAFLKLGKIPHTTTIIKFKSFIPLTLLIEPSLLPNLQPFVYFRAKLRYTERLGMRS